MGLWIKVICSGVIFILVLYACGSSEQNAENTVKNTNEYAEHFQLQDFDTYKQLDIFNPWQESEGITYTYYLAGDDLDVPDQKSNENIIITPLKTVICMSTTQIAFIDALGETDVIKGVSGKQYIYNKTILNDNNIQDVGYDSGIDYEMIMHIQPDLVLLYGIGSDITGIAKKLKDLGIQTMIIAEHLESTPLAKFEWIKVFGALFDLEKTANTYFKGVSDRYNKFAGLLDDSLHKPSVLTGMPYKDIWYVSSANTNIANLIADAGGCYIWSDNQKGDVIALDIEAVMSKAEHADIWINTGTAGNKKEILAMDERLGGINAFEKDMVFNNNNRLNKYGGNDYYESGVVKPDIVLRDLIKIVRPELMEDHEFFYYTKLK